MKIRLTLCLVWFLVASASFGQTFYGSLVGTVNDASSSAVPQANVTLTNLGTAERRTMQSDSSGNYQFVNLVPGEYKIEVEKIGFRRFARDPITVEVQSTVRIDVGMQVGDVNQVIEVTAQTPLLQTENASLGQVVDSRKVLESPLNGRNIYGLVALVPGVVPGGQSGTTPTGTNPFAWGNYQIGGGQSNQSAAYIDGAGTSAAYWLASAAGKVYAGDDTTAVGSIGVIATHYDQSAADAAHRYSALAPRRCRRAVLVRLRAGRDGQNGDRGQGYLGADRHHSSFRACLS